MVPKISQNFQKFLKIFKNFSAKKHEGYINFQNVSTILYSKESDI